MPAILRNNFENNQNLKEMILNLPKYGNDCDDVDCMMQELVELSLHTLECYKCESGGSYQGGFYAVWLHG